MPVGAKCRKHWQAWVIWLSASFWRALTPDWAVIREKRGSPSSPSITKEEYMFMILYRKLPGI